MGREITLNFQYRDIDGLKEMKSTAYLLSESIYYEVVDAYITFHEIPKHERGKKELTILDADSYRAFEIYCEKVTGDISEMTAVQFIEMVLQRQENF